MRNAHKLEKLLVTHARTIQNTRNQLAMNFDIPSREIIQMACSEMGITEKIWREMESYSIAKAAPLP